MLANLTTSLTVFALAATAPQGAQWEADYGKALAQTRADSRPLLVVIDTPQAEKQALPAVDAELLGAYDLCRIDAGTEYGKKVAGVFKAKAFPYVAIIDKTGAVILHSQTGELTEAAFASTLTKFKAGERPIVQTVAKPVITEPGVVIEASPVQSTPVYFYQPPADCPNCRRGY